MWIQSESGWKSWGNYYVIIEVELIYHLINIGTQWNNLIYISWFIFIYFPGIYCKWWKTLLIYRRWRLQGHFRLRLQLYKWCPTSLGSKYQGNFHNFLIFDYLVVFSKVILLRGDDIHSGRSLVAIGLHFRSAYLGVSVLGTHSITGLCGITR